METKFFSEIEKRMSVKTLKDFEKEVRGKIINEFESLRKKNDDLSRVLMAGETELWKGIKDGKYPWITISKNKNRLYRLIDIYSNFAEMVEDVKQLNKKIDEVKKLKDLPDDESPMDENWGEKEYYGFGKELSFILYQNKNTLFKYVVTFFTLFLIQLLY